MLLGTDRTANLDILEQTVNFRARLLERSDSVLSANLK